MELATNILKQMEKNMKHKQLKRKEKYKNENKEKNYEELQEKRKKKHKGAQRLLQVGTKRKFTDWALKEKGWTSWG